jgi:hypothetical protein
MTASTPDFRALCAELAVELENWMDRTDHRPASSVELFDSARAALATPEPPPPLTDEELRKLWLDQRGRVLTSGEVVTIARAVLERWGHG